MNTQPTAFRSGSVVWVSTGEPAYETEGSHIARVIDVKDNIAALQHSETGELEYHRTDRICEVCPFPIDEKHILSDFISDELLELAGGWNNEYLGWITNNNRHYPLYCKVTRDGHLEIHSVSREPAAFAVVQEYIKDIFDCNPNSRIVSSKVIRDNIMTVKFYSFYN